ncbi:MAG: universal stress protein [Bacteroidota bacterium]
MPYRAILCPTDHSACAEAALAYGAEVAVHHEAAVHTLFVEPPRLPGASTDFAMQAAVLQPVEEAAYEAQTFSQDAGDIAHAILAYVEAHPIDLVVMGTAGRRGVDRFILGSVAETLVREAPCPVATVNRHIAWRKQEATGITVAPVDFSSANFEVLRRAAQLVQMERGTLHLVHVCEAQVLPSAEAVYAAVDTTVYLKEAAQRRLQEWTEALQEDTGLPAGQVRPVIETGGASEQILAYATRTGADRIVLATHGRSGWRRFLLGSVAERVVRRAPCPVITFGPAALDHAGDAVPPAEDVQSSA